jgi:hypothetical protein
MSGDLSRVLLQERRPRARETIGKDHMIITFSRGNFLVSCLALIIQGKTNFSFYIPHLSTILDMEPSL